MALKEKSCKKLENLNLFGKNRIKQYAGFFQPPMEIEIRMISIPDLISLVKSAVPDAEVNALDKTGMKDHFIVHVTSKAFEEVGIMDRHRMVMAALDPAMKDGRIHAAEVKTATP